ncbi:MAG TPA: zinc dependent phospholipase C family protein [Acidobacteriaceae bacterium]|nr:zinc dependent phospholipase C family protein [Acidobacteriaceae bacterium]
MRSLRTSFISAALLLSLLSLVSPRPARAYAVLTHEEIVDLTWADSIQPLLLHRFPNLTPEQLQEAHAYAYGGSLIQDMGYYPLGQPSFSNLLHYVRTGDFIASLFRESKDQNDVAFAIGALSHYLGDTIGHPSAVNLAVGKSFPELAAKYGPNVNYAEGKHQHVRAEFAFDINDIAKHRLAPEKYLNHIGFAIPVPLLARAFYDTYGLDLAKVLKKSHPKLRGYRYAVRALLPRVAYAETLLNRKRMPPDVPSPALDEFTKEVAALSAANNWDSYRRHAGIGTHLLAAFIFVLPKFGPLSILSLRGPTPSAEQDYVNSLMHTTDVFRQKLASATKSDGLPNLDLDTGDQVYPGTYPLEDDTYAALLHSMTSDPTKPIPFGIKRDLLAYFADPTKAKYLEQKPAKLAQVNSDLPILRTISTKAQYPETAFLPEPDEAKPNPDTKNLSPAATGSAPAQATAIN